MDPTIIAAIIGVIGILLGAIAQPYLSAIIEEKRLERHGIPDIAGQYNGSWYIGTDRSKTLYVKDCVEIRLSSGFKIKGNGKDEKGMYRIEGEVSFHGIITLSYSYKNSGLPGVAILKIEPLGKQLTGIWYGYLKEQEISGGYVLWKKVLAA